MNAYRTPMNTAARRRATNVFPRAIVNSAPFLATVEAGLSKLRDKRALIVWGDKDIAFRAKERERFEALFPSHRTVIVPGAGHFMQEDAHEEISAALLEWWSAR